MPFPLLHVNPRKQGWKICFVDVFFLAAIIFLYIAPLKAFFNKQAI